MAEPTVSTAVLQDDGRYLVTLSDGATFYTEVSSGEEIALLRQILATLGTISGLTGTGSLGPHGGIEIEGVASGTVVPVAGSFTVGGDQAVDGSTTITAGGTAQDLFSSTAPPNGYEVINPDPGEDLWISDTTTAVANGTGCIRVAANGGTYVTPTGMKPPNHTVSIVGATTGHEFTARYW